jgi:hypothetical protein
MDQTSVLENDAEMTSILLFHPYEPLLAVADDQVCVCFVIEEIGKKK